VSRLADNPRITAKERNLIKGALRRVFARSDLRRQALEKTIVQHSDPARPRVKTWCRCPECHAFKAKSEMQVDHVEPIVPLLDALEEMSADDLVNRIWCAPENLRAICEDCHDAKTKAERKVRDEARRARKKSLR
jgi:5-methylcytosine-specific restriction endonuclease McrA